MAPHFAYYHMQIIGIKCRIMNTKIYFQNQILIFKNIHKCISHNCTFVQTILCSFLSHIFYIPISKNWYIILANLWSCYVIFHYVDIHWFHKVFNTSFRVPPFTIKLKTIFQQMYIAGLIHADMLYPWC